MNERGQTPQDFAVGASILLVTIIGAFAFIQGGALSVYEDPVTEIEQPQADRIASYLVENYSVGDQRNIVLHNESGGLNRTLSNDTELANLTAHAAVNVSSSRRTDPTLNVSIVNNSTLQSGQLRPARAGSKTLAWGEAYDNQTASTSTRVIRLRNDRVTCEPVCWLVVRAW
ncbi:hypothetical protein ACFQL1_14890 [Halomicroarcula sp. GCM10025709]|uniref:DUF7287 family protein n=1 Tax=Haloarcula TaxID=2237 RepID=UPI0024C3DB96|nr:hypothetical protein [Halomicroarcula sp. YJ-61-S]